MRGERSIAALGGGGISNMELTTIEAASASLDGSFIFHVVADIVGFVLFMHQQIPSVLQDLTFEFDELQEEFKDLETALAQEETRGSLRRKHASRKREVRIGIKRLEKLMNMVSSMKTALQLIITEIPCIESVLLVLGPSPLRPMHIYELHFSRRARVSSGDYTRTRVVETLCKKAIRELVSRGAGSSSYPGPTKLYLLVRAPSSLSLPLHFLPKRDFKCNKKVAPIKLQFRGRGNDGLGKTAYHDDDNQAENAISFSDSASDDIIWFQCRHVIKGLASRTSTEED
nr:Melanoma inhibitory activity protein [Ipomoea batatas]GMD56287.1 Melanoma inhibitory activity protein [Ipomoea batatas]